MLSSFSHLDCVAALLGDPPPRRAAWYNLRHTSPYTASFMQAELDQFLLSLLSAFLSVLALFLQLRAFLTYFCSSSLSDSGRLIINYEGTRGRFS